MNKEKLVRMLIPIVAVLVIAESVFLVSGLNKASEVSNSVTGDGSSSEATGSGEVMNERLPVADYVFATDTKEMKVGKSYRVSLNLLAKEDFTVDAIETYVEFDPEIVTISKIVANKDLPTNRTLKIDDKSGLVTAIFLVPVEDKGGISVSASKTKEVYSFTVTPKKEGEFTLALVTEAGEGKLVTVLPETGTSESLPFISSKLDINVTK